jgi:hypothetical protein
VRRRTPKPHALNLRDSRASAILVAGIFGAASVQLTAAACGSSAAPNPFVAQGGGSATGQGGAGGAGGQFDGGPAADETLGGPCTVDSQCDDGHACTFDACDQSIKHCRFTPDHSKCQNGAVCDGQEVCSNKLGCIPGEPKTCSDGQPCTIDSCDEATGSCKSEKRDADADGDPDVHCGGGDCDDEDPLVSSKQAEVCANGKDDNCNKQIDEASCGKPQNDDCFKPLAIDKAGTYAMTTVAAKLDYSSSCPVLNAAGARDVVAALALPAGKADVQLTARTDLGLDVSVALVGQCGQPGSEIGCSKGYNHPKGGRVAKMRARSIGGDNAMSLPVYVTTSQPAPVTLRYELLPASTKPANETCGTAVALQDGVPTVASVVDAKTDVASICPGVAGDLVYKFELTEPRDVHLYASSLDDDGLPVVSLRNANCALPSDEITCGAAPFAGKSAHVYRHALPVGTYHVSVAASAPTEALLTLQTAPPTPPPADESCNNPPALVPGKTIDVSLENHQDDIHTGCKAGGVDAAYKLELKQASDVLIVGRFSNGDSAAVEIAKPACKTFSDQLVCGIGYLSPARARLHNLAAGEYRVIAESVQAQPMQLTALVRPAGPPILVPFADNCTDAQKIPAGGGFFQGNTTNAKADFNAGCDQGNQPPGTAPDQLLVLELSQPKRVFFDMQGSGYSTILSVRQGPGCPGAEIAKACAVGYYPDRSFLDLTLGAGTYYVQIDGFVGQTGSWFLDVFVTEPAGP